MSRLFACIVTTVSFVVSASGGLSAEDQRLCRLAALADHGQRKCGRDISAGQSRAIVVAASLKTSSCVAGKAEAKGMLAAAGPNGACALSIDWLAASTRGNATTARMGRN